MDPPLELRYFAYVRRRNAAEVTYCRLLSLPLKNSPPAIFNFFEHGVFSFKLACLCTISSFDSLCIGLNHINRVLLAKVIFLLFLFLFLF